MIQIEETIASLYRTFTDFSGRLRILGRTILALILSLIFSTSHAHEFWFEILPASSPESVAIRAFQGEGLQGEPFNMEPHPEGLWFAELGSSESSSTMPMYNNDGSVSFSLAGELSGHLLINYQSPPALTVHKNFADFSAYTRDEGLEHIAQQHQAQGLPGGGLTEIFYRHTKNLVCGFGFESNGKDRDYGNDYNSPAEYEWVLLDSAKDIFNRIDNPEKKGSLTLQLLHEDKPIAGQPVHIFLNSLLSGYQHLSGKTNEHGSLDIDYDGDSDLLVSTTLMGRPDAKTMLETAALWESHWVAYRLSTELCN